MNDVGLEEAIHIAGHLLRRLAIPAPKGVPRLEQVAQRLSETLPMRWKQQGQPFPRCLLERACDLALQLAPSTSDLLVNFDLIYADMLASVRRGWS